MPNNSNEHTANQAVPVKPQTETEAKPNPARLMVELMEEKVELFFVDTQGRPFMTWYDGNALKASPIDSSAVRDLIRLLYRDAYDGRVAGKDAINNAISQLEANARLSGQVRKVFVRTAALKDAIYVDLANEKNQVVEIDASGWRIITDPPVPFVRTKTMKALPVPERDVNGDGLERLRDLVTVKDGDWILLLSFLVGSYVPKGAIPILIVNGEQGSAKSTTTRLIKELLDPSSAVLRMRPRKEDAVAVAAQHSRVVCYDNVSKVEEWLSDMLCSLSTGTAITARALYTDSEESVIEVKCPVVLNGIPPLANRPDLADRSIILTLQPIPEHKRVEESKYWEQFEAVEPVILGAIMDALVECFQNREQVDIELPRMADFARWAAAGSGRLGFTTDQFSDAYADNRKEARNLSAEANPLVDLVVDWIRKRATEWRGQVAELHKVLGNLVGNDSQWFPIYTNRFGADLVRAAGLIRARGIDIFDRTIDGYRVWTIREKPNVIDFSGQNVPDRDAA